jgi:tRNA A37 N6-isopentenylltransferase MiaA
MRSLGYNEIADSIKSGTGADLEAKVVAATRKYAKRQETFFRSEAGATWIDVSEAGWQQGLASRIERFLSGEST